MSIIHTYLYFFLFDLHLKTFNRSPNFWTLGNKASVFHIHECIPFDKTFFRKKIFLPMTFHITNQAFVWYQNDLAVIRWHQCSINTFCLQIIDPGSTIRDRFYIHVAHEYKHTKKLLQNLFLQNTPARPFKWYCYRCRSVVWIQILLSRDHGEHGLLVFFCIHTYLI